MLCPIFSVSWSLMPLSRKWPMNACTLCESPVLPTKCFRDQDHLFCCAGCQAVHQILQAKKALDNFREHPLFQQAVKSGLISNPELLEQLREQANEDPHREILKLHIEVQEMWCPSCALLIKLILLREKGVRRCLVDYTTDLASIEFDPQLITKERIYKTIEKLGYRPCSLQDPRGLTVNRSLFLRFIVAAFFAANIMMFAYPIYASYFHDEMQGYPELFAWLSLFGSLPVLTYSAWPIWRRFFIGLRVGIWGMEALVFLGVAAATGLSLYELGRGSPYVYFDSMTVIITFVLLGKMIESKAKFSAKESLVRLMRAVPRKGRKRFEDGSEAFVLIKEIQPHDQIVVLSGEKIVLDGRVIAGEGSCDESLMTGEAVPILKQVGSTALAGTVLQQGYLVIEVTSTIEETALYRIIEMVEEDMQHKSKEVRLVDQVVRWFVPGVLALACLTAAYCLYFEVQDPSQSTLQTAIIRAVSVLLISCPCAIGIAAPLADSYTLDGLAKLGAVVRNRGCLSFLGRETVFVFDKTGTITEGKFSVIAGLEVLSDWQKQILKGLTARSIHPIALAVHQALNVPALELEAVEEVIGMGMRGVVGQSTYLLGSQTFLRMQGVEMQVDPTAKSTNTRIYFAVNGRCVTTIELGDQLRTDAYQLIKALKGVKTYLVSGDGPEVVEKVARECQFDAWFASYHPLQKRALVDRLKHEGEIVAVMGDGINDAPALTSAHVGIAVVSATDISIQVSDLLLTSDRLLAIVNLRRLASKGRSVTRQNLFWAFFYNMIGIGLAMMGALSPLFAAFAMVISSFVVLCNVKMRCYE